MPAQHRYELKPISSDAIARAMSKAERYRLLNEPREAESICRDILAADGSNQDAALCLLLSITDQFGGASGGGGGGPGVSVQKARDLLPKLRDDYQRAYYEGVIAERWAKSQLDAGVPGQVVFDWFRAAMTAFERAETLRPKGDDDAILRWNTCARLLNDHPGIAHRPEQESPSEDFSDSLPVL
jgi:hypothetical protein